MQASTGTNQEVSRRVTAVKVNLTPQVLWKHFQDRMKANAEYEKELTLLGRELIERLPVHLNNEHFFRTMQLTDMNQFLMSVLRAHSHGKGYSSTMVTGQLSQAMDELSKAWAGIIKVEYHVRNDIYFDIQYKLDQSQV